MMQKAMLVIQCVRMFLAGTNHGSPPVSRVSSSKSVDRSPEQDENARYEDIKEGIVECVISDQNAPSLKTVANTSDLRKPILKKLIHVLHSLQAFKAHEGNYLQHPQVDEASDSLATSFEHHVTIEIISTIVRQKNMPALQEFGDLGRVKYALCTDFDNGISENEAQNRSQQHAPSLNLSPTNTFFHFIWEEVKKKTILLLLVSVALTTVFGIIQKGLKYGCYDGLVVLIAIVLLVLFASIRKYWQEKRAQKKLQNHRFLEREEGKVQVRRAGQPKDICESELVRGDILLLKKGDEVPCDGLFVGGEPLELYYGLSESCIINEQNPFLSYGERVINGNARMVVTSTNIETDWSEMMSKAIGDPSTMLKLETQLDKLNNHMHNIQIVISILIILVSIFRCVGGKIDDENANRPESMAESTGMRTFSDTFKKIIKESKYTTKVLTKLLSVSLVGLTEGVPFVVSLAIVYWNDKILSGKDMEQDPHTVAKMAHVTRICTDTFFTEDRMEVENVFIGGEFIMSRLDTLSPDVMEVLHDGISTLKQKQFPWVKDILRSKSKKRWKTIEMKGTAKSFEEPCGVLMRGMKENEELVWHFNGSVKEILNMCKHYYDITGHKAPLDDEMAQKFVQAIQDRQHEHKLTTIALAYKPTHAGTQDLDHLILIALLVLKIKNNEDTNTQVKELRKRGIETVIVSSKKLSVLEDIACKSEVITNGNSESLVITGEVFRKYTHKERHEKVDKIRVLGEALPSDKLLLVQTLEETGKAVTFLGQRTDEAPALKTAHIGVAMGTWSSEKAIESSDIIMDGIFGNLIKMVDSGKCIYYNIQSFIQIVLITTFGSTLIGLIETAAFGDASLTVFQSALVNFSVVVLGGLALLTKVSTEKLLSSDPISYEQSVITAEMARNILFQVSYQAMCSVIIQRKGPAFMSPNEDMKTMVSNTFVFCQFFNLFNSRELQQKNFFRGILWHKEFWVATAMFIVLNASFVMAQDVLGYGTRLSWTLWAGCVLLGAVSWLVDWLGKYISGFIKIFVN